MAEKSLISIIVPAYNERQRIGHTLDTMQAYLDRQHYDYEIIVVVDGNDGAYELVHTRALHDTRMHVFGNIKRLGKGRSIRQGVMKARGQIIGFVDADNKTPIEELDKVLPLFNEGFDIVIASRALSESYIEISQPFYRQLGSRAFGLVMHLMIGLWDIKDTQCGFKFFRREIAHTIFSHQRINGYMFDVEVLYLAAQNQYRIKEIGVHWRDDGDSRYNPISGTFKNAIELCYICFVSRFNRDTHISRKQRSIEEVEEQRKI